jgi:hypothetical protein
VTWCIVEEEQALCLPFSEPLKDVHCLIDLHEKFLGSEPALAILPGLEKNACIPENDLM